MNDDCQKILSRYYGHIPAIILPDKNIEICKRRFLLPMNESFGFCCVSIRNHIKLKSSEAIFFLIDNKIVDMSQNVGAFYSQYKLNKKPSDAYLYITIIKENTFGWGMYIGFTGYYAWRVYEDLNPPAIPPS